MPLFEMTVDGDLVERPPATFTALHIKERDHLQRTLRDKIGVLGDDLMVIAEEFGDWEGAARRIDLLALDRDGHLVVIELKRTDTGGHMELQALRYAAMVSAMTFDQLVAAHRGYLVKRGGIGPEEASERIRSFLDVTDDDDPAISTDVRIILVSGDFSREVTTTVLWLNRLEGMDIRCVRLVPYELEGKHFVDIEQVIPLPEAADYQVQVRRKEEKQKRTTSGQDWTMYSVVTKEGTSPPLRKRQAMLRMIQALHTAGVSIAAIQPLLPAPRHCRTLAGELHTAPEVEHALRAQGVTEPDRYFLDAAIVEDGNTYVVSKMWGQQTGPTLQRLVEEFSDLGISYSIAE